MKRTLIAAFMLLGFATFGQTLDTTDSTASIENPIAFDEPSRDPVVLYPNPVQSELTVSMDDDQAVKTISVYSMTSRLMHQETTQSNEITVDLSDLPSGRYNVLVHYGDKAYMKHIVKN